LTRKEAEDVIRECQKLRKSIDKLLIKAMRSLHPELKVIKGGKGE